MVLLKESDYTLRRYRQNGCQNYENRYTHVLCSMYDFFSEILVSSTDIVGL